MQNISINIEKKEFLNYENKIKPHIAIKNFNLEIAKTKLVQENIHLLENVKLYSDENKQLYDEILKQSDNLSELTSP